MSIFTRSIITPFEALAVDTVYTKDLPVNPISFLLLTIKFQNDTAYTKATLGNLLACLDRVTIRFRGSNVIALSGIDLFAYGYILWRKMMHQVNEIDLEDGIRSITIPIPFGRFPYDPAFAFPATSRGQLIFELDSAAAFTNIEETTWGLEAVELPDGVPTSWLRCTTLAHTPAAVGDTDIELPIGNPLKMIILYGTTVPTDTTATRTINSAQLMVDNAQRYYSKSDFETLHNAMGLRCLPPVFYDDHIHASDMAAAYTQYQDTNPAERAIDKLGHYMLMDLDPTDDGLYILETAGLSDLKLRIDAGDTNAIRILPVELFTIGI